MAFKLFSLLSPKKNKLIKQEQKRRQEIWDNATERCLEMSPQELLGYANCEIGELFFELIEQRAQEKAEPFELETKQGFDKLNSQQQTWFVLEEFEFACCDICLPEFFIKYPYLAPLVSNALGEIGAKEQQVLFDSFVFEQCLDLKNLPVEKFEKDLNKNNDFNKPYYNFCNDYKKLDKSSPVTFDELGFPVEHIAPDSPYALLKKYVCNNIENF